MEWPPCREDVNELVREVRGRCLWFLRPDDLPGTDAERLRVLELVERYGDREVFRRARILGRWLSQPFSATSAAS